jgi:DNA-binding beta-propeller fold protein YncE
MTVIQAKVTHIFGEPGEGNGRFLKPSTIGQWQENLFVGDVGSGSLQSFTSRGIFRLKLEANADGHFTNPAGLACGRQGHVYLTDSTDQKIRVFDQTGKPSKTFTNPCNTAGGLQGLCLDQSSRLYVCDSESGCVQILQAETGAYLGQIGSKGKGEGQFQLPCAVAVDSSGQIYVVDFGLARVSIFSKAGKYVSGFGGKGISVGMFNVPRAIALDRANRIYISDFINHRIQIFDQSGTWLYAFGTRGQDAGQFSGPAGIVYDQNKDLLYVCDQGNQRVQTFSLSFSES